MNTDKNYKVLGIIPARGGSKSIPKKNIKLLLGKPLLAWTIEEAKKSKYVDRVVVSTDDEQIAEVAAQYGAEVPFMRPSGISQDLSKDIDFILHAADFFKKHEKYEPDIIAHLRPTSPLRTALHIDKGIEILINTPQADSVRSITESPKHPYKMWRISKDKEWIEPFLPKSFTHMDEPYNSPRQILPDAYVSAGAVDVMRLSTIRKLNSVSGKRIAYFYMKPEESVNIDNPVDFKIAAILMKERENR